MLTDYDHRFIDADGRLKPDTGQNHATLKRVYVQPPTSAVNVTPPAFAAERRRPLSINISCPWSAQQQTRRTPLLLWDRIDERTDARPFHRPCSAYSADSVN